MNPLTAPVTNTPTIDQTTNVPRNILIQDAIERREAVTTTSGALASWMPDGETGRIPKDTYMVRDSVTESNVDWSSSACIPMTPEIFDELFKDAISALAEKTPPYVLDRSIGADPEYALPVNVITNRALSALYVDNMFRPELADKEGQFTLLVLPYDKVQTEKYGDALREGGNKLVAMDFERRLGIVYGCSYLGAIKKLMFTVMNYLLPDLGVLPLHCSANEGVNGNTALFLGLSGTGKTTLSNQPGRNLIGDDEHGWGESGIANFENGCYAKMIRLSETKEPEIFTAVFSERDVSENGVIIDNALVYPDGTVDLNDDRLTENSRASYPLEFLPTAKQGSQGGHPEAIILLTADAHGVLPPVAKLTKEQAEYWFLMGYTSKLAGTEAGITTPVSTFSRFFGGPFMARHPKEYLELFEQKISKHNTDVFLVNTGWTGGSACAKASTGRPTGVGERIPIPVSRAIVDAVLQGTLKDVRCVQDDRFHFSVPCECPGVVPEILNPKNTWKDPVAFEKAADGLAQEFATFFDANFADSGLSEAVIQACPGK